MCTWTRKSGRTLPIPICRTRIVIIMEYNFVYNFRDYHWTSSVNTRLLYYYGLLYMEKIYEDSTHILELSDNTNMKSKIVKLHLRGHFEDNFEIDKNTF